MKDQLSSKVRQASLKQRIFVLLYFIYAIFMYLVSNGSYYGFDTGFFIGSTIVFPMFIYLIYWVYAGFKQNYPQKYNYFRIIRNGLFKSALSILGYSIISAALGVAVGAALVGAFYLLGYITESSYNYETIFYKTSLTTFVLMLLSCVKLIDFKSKFVRKKSSIIDNN